MKTENLVEKFSTIFSSFVCAAKKHTNDDASDINREIRVDTSASELKFQLKAFTTKKKSR